ncbi:hypothetical protein B0A49_06373 [Cryomyces minteri]|uniref:Mso1 N-terminal domain-containing protein n=1 Tax=Cryomyces minteri TaxID=331657 RepID=A0A4U0X2E7_9PEZI|nr:hypothetical protein B0A49_06373 [Cryomyces minteri]
MSSYLSTLLTTTTTRYATLRRALTSSEADGDTEDDSHISRVLRAYYTEKGRPFPAWLPPDPNAKQQAHQQAVQAGYATSSGQGRQGQGQYAGGGSGNTSLRSTASGAGGRGALSDLWDPPAASAQQPASLRRGPRPQPPPQASQPGGRGSLDGAGGGAGAGGAVGGGGTAQERLKARLWGQASPTGGGGAGAGTQGQGQGPGHGSVR